MSWQHAARRGLWALSLAAAALAGPLAEAAVQRVAVVIGANTGVGDDVSLHYAERDAERIAEVLEELGSVRAEDVVLLRGVDAWRVREVFATLADRVRAATERGDETVLFVYYSGHADGGSLRLDGSQLPFAELTALLDKVPVDVRVLVVDACKSGELTRLKGATPAEPFTIRADDRLDSEGVAVITSSSLGEDAQESDRLRGGIFTHHFIAGLVGAADASQDGRITLTEAYRYAYGQTIRATSQARFVQHPAYAFRLRGSEDVVLTRVDDPTHSGTLLLDTPGDYLIFREKREAELVLEISVADRTRVTLPPGSYLVRRRGAELVREAEVAVERGHTSVLDDEAMVALAYGRTVRKGLAERKRLAVGISLAGGITGATIQGTGAAPTAGLRVRFDLVPLTLTTRVHYTPQRLTNEFLTTRIHRVGLDLAVSKMFDVGRVAPGIGVRGGLDWFGQDFDTPGVAPSRSGLGGRVGMLVGLDVSVAPRFVIGMSGGADILLYSTGDGADARQIRATPVPYGSLELTAYVF